MRTVAQSAEFSYRLFGLGFLSGEPIPGVPTEAEITRCDAIHIEFGATPRSIPAPEYQNARVQATGAEYLFHCPGLGRISVQGSERIVFERAVERGPGTTSAMWRLILGAGASMAGFRRGFVPIHASAVVDGNDCIAFAGKSKAGKSTIAGLLNGLGYRLHADDLCLAYSSDRQVAVGAGVPELRLDEDAVGMVGWNDVEPVAIAAAGKSAFRWGTPEGGPRPLRRIYILEFASESSQPGIYRISGVVALSALIDCLRLRLPLLLTGLAPRNFERIAAISRTVEMFRFVRPLDANQSWYWTKRLAEHFKTESV
jgi:hypothetical protein